MRNTPSLLRIRRGTGRLRSRALERGFTLLEVILALFVFLSGVVGVLSLFAAASAYHQEARERSMAVFLVPLALAEIEARIEDGSYRDAKGQLKPLVEGTLPGEDRFRYRAELRESAETGRSPVFARVTITWQKKGRERGETIDHIFRPGPAAAAAVAAARSGGGQPESKTSLEGKKE